jgi:predicted nuclease of predicted toxin-antitoxin system
LKILLDECLPRRLGRWLTGHDVQTVRQMNWLGLSNGRLLTVAEPAFDAFITVDKNLVLQQQAAARRLAVIVLRVHSNKIEDIAPLVPQVLTLLPTLKPGQVVTVGA